MPVLLLCHGLSSCARLVALGWLFCNHIGCRCCLSLYHEFAFCARVNWKMHSIYTGIGHRHSSCSSCGLMFCEFSNNFCGLFCIRTHCTQYLLSYCGPLVCAVPDGKRHLLCTHIGDKRHLSACHAPPSCVASRISYVLS